MADFYGDLAATAADLLSEFGKSDAILRTRSVSAYDDVAGTVTEAAATDEAIKAVQVEFNEKFTPGAEIEAGDKMFVVAAEVALTQKLVISGTEYSIVQVWPVTPGDTNVVTRVQVRA